MKYLIHTYDKRLWYVKDFMIPSMLKQGIAAADIEIYLDSRHIGNLEACMSSFNKLPEEGSTWHLQDDILISSRFKEITEKYNNYNGLVNGVCTLFDERNRCKVGEDLVLDDSWYSFPCIMIPNKLAKDCSKWFYNTLGDPKYFKWSENHNGDDYIFKEYLYKYYPDIKVVNLVPNIVDHIDCLINGSVANERSPEMNVRSKYWEEEELFNELKEKLKGVDK